MKRITQIVAAFLISARVFAATETHTVTLPLQFTDFTNTFVLPQFDPAVGTLNSATLVVAASGTSQTSVENRDTIPWTAITGSSVNFDLSGLITVGVTNTFTNTLSAFDGIIDFAGTSGVSNAPIVAVATSTAALAPASVTGTGLFPLTFKANGLSQYSGPGVNRFRVRTQAEAVVSIVYDFTPDCPVPAPAPAPTPTCEPKPFYTFCYPKGYGCRRP